MASLGNITSVSTRGYFTAAGKGDIESIASLGMWTGAIPAAIVIGSLTSNTTQCAILPVHSEFIPVNQDFFTIRERTSAVSGL